LEELPDFLYQCRNNRYVLVIKKEEIFAKGGD
jgi:hypothetical protein